MAIGVLLAGPGGASAQGPSSLSLDQQLEVQQQRLLDLKDHREWLEDQLALAKALLNETRHALAQKEADLAACRSAHDKDR